MKLTVPDLMKSADGGGHWVTIKKEGPLHGRHIKIDGSGHIIAGHGIPRSVIEHLNNGRLGIDVNKHTEPAEDPHLAKAKEHAQASPNALDFAMKLAGDEGARNAVKHSGKSVTDFHAEHGPKKEAAPAAPLDRAKELAKNAKSVQEFTEAMKGDKEALTAAVATGQTGRELYREWNDAARAERDAPKAGHPTPEALPDHVEKHLRGLEQGIRNDDMETGHIVSPDGRTLWSNPGGKDYVDISSGAGHLEGGILTHNHPQGNSFSKEDVAVLLQHGLKEMRAVGAKYTHRVQAPENYSGSLGAYSRIFDLIHETEKNVRDDFTNAVQSGKMTVQEAQGTHFHELWTRVARATGMRYERSEN